LNSFNFGLLQLGWLASWHLNLEREEDATDTAEKIWEPSYLERATPDLSPPTAVLGFEAVPDLTLKPRLGFLHG